MLLWKTALHVCEHLHYNCSIEYEHHYAKKVFISNYQAGSYTHCLGGAVYFSVFTHAVRSL